MNPKMKSAIEKITLNDATFSNEVIEPTYVNFFYGKNGAGKSTIARTFKTNDEHLQWQDGRVSTDYDVLVYDTDFINANLRNYGNLAGVFTVNETNIAIQEQVDTLNAERKKMGEEYNGHKATIDQKVADKSAALSTFQSNCWSKSAEDRTLFDEAIKGKKKAALFAQEILAITPVAHNFDELKALFLYYYHLVKGSLSSEAVKDKIVVIDDPVSSMDSGALFIVSALVREMIEVCYNNTDYRSHKVDGDYIKQIFILTHNVYFHKEITHHQAKRYHSVSFYMIRKVENISSVKLCVRQSQRVPTEQENYNPIQNSYAALWDEYKELKTANTVKNVIRHILEYYFIQICGYEGNDLHKIVLEQNKPLFVAEVEGQKPNYDRYNLASSMLTYMNDGPAVISDGFNYIDDGSDVEQCKKVFELIFTAMHQEQHYKMMMGIED